MSRTVEKGIDKKNNNYRPLSRLQEHIIHGYLEATCNCSLETKLIDERARNGAFGINSVHVDAQQHCEFLSEAHK